VIGHRRVQSRRWAAVVGRYRPLARGARGVKPAAPPATGACPLERAPAATGAHAAAEAIGAGVGQAANRPPVAARCRTEAEAVRVTQHTGHRRTRHGPAARRWDGATDIGIPVVTLVAGIWPQTDDSAVLAQFTGESRSSKRSPRPKNPPISARGCWRNAGNPGNNGIRSDIWGRWRRRRPNRKILGRLTEWPVRAAIRMPTLAGVPSMSLRLCVAIGIEALTGQPAPF